MKSRSPRAAVFVLAWTAIVVGCGGRDPEEIRPADGGFGEEASVRDARPGSSTGICAPPPPSAFRPTCDNAAAVAAVAGRWSSCGDGSMPEAPPHDGIEFANGEGFYFLHRDGAGVLTRGTADTNRGTVKAASGPNCIATTEIHTAAGRRFWSTARPHDTSPRQLWLYTDPAWEDPERFTLVEP